MVVRTKKTKKSVGQRGQTNHGWGARKKHMGKGHKGGKGMAGTGKRADHKKSLIIKKYGNKYFGKKGITSLHAKKKKIPVVNLRDIQKNIKQLAKKGEVILKDKKILGEGEIKEKLNITAQGFTKSAKEKIEKAGGQAIIFKIKGNQKKGKVENEK